MNELKKEIKEKEKELKKIKQLIKIAKDISQKSEYLNTITWIIYNDNLVIEPNGTQQFMKCRKELRKIFNDYTDKMYSIDSPSGSYIIVRYHTNNNLLDIWINYKDEKDLPKSITKNGKCKFKEYTVKQKSFVCEKE